MPDDVHENAAIELCQDCANYEDCPMNPDILCDEYIPKSLTGECTEACRL